MVIESLKSFTKYLHSIACEKYPSRKVMNFRRLLGCDTIVTQNTTGDPSLGQRTKKCGLVVKFPLTFHEAGATTQFSLYLLGKYECVYPVEQKSTTNEK